ncbi:hypothetical protein [Micromonospora chalcea]|uniref:hypothetical protein n=1 Tax=Micromonospora chalcea TaxID=1874 RepID=UPI000DE9A303|nr:hypothetical protein DQE82_23305 [Micromonospora sp. LHW51205]
MVVADIEPSRLRGWSDVSTDIWGGVEIRPHGTGSPWELTDISLREVSTIYDAFGLLFGVRNFAGFEPVAPGRGLPDDVSASLRARHFTERHHDPTWVSWAEVARIDWSAPSPRVDDRIHVYDLTAEGPRYRSKATRHGRSWREVAGEHADHRGSSYPEGTEWRSGNVMWRVERLSNSDALQRDPALRAVLEGMRELAERHGEDNVRLVVWFDS